MFLAVDIGNTHTTLGLMQAGKVLTHRRLTTHRNSTADELHVMLRFMERIEDVKREEWQGAAICSVAPAVNRAMAAAVRRVTGVEPLLLDPSMDLGIRNAYSNPLEVGMDRLANAVAGVAEFGAPLVIVDYGTATTLDIVSREGDYLGGVILPGLEATADALYMRTSKLPQINIERPPGALGRTTVHAMQSGIFFGSIDAVEGVTHRIEQELGYELRLVATGGLARVLSPDMKRLHAVDDDLTLKGTWLIWKRNRRSSQAGA
ncbi:MAG: type III pantothenate kinase [Candidatus Sumerlaeia bacterium]|nr:type III pantothenate kinase [Candidatus Sumerlaeia bacterium]